MIPMPLSEVARAVGGELPQDAPEVVVCGVCTDSREVSPGDLFVAIRGQRTDGHAYLAEAIGGGASACLVSQKSTDVRTPQVVVRDTVVSLGALAAYYRTHFIDARTRVIAVTGSNGKTTTKRLIHHLLSVGFRGTASPKSFNNNIGVPLTLLSVERDDHYVVVEIGTNAPGEVEMLGRMASPDIAVLTSVGAAHLEGLSSVEAIAAEKASLIDCLRPGGTAVVNVDRRELRSVLRVPQSVALRTYGGHESAQFQVAVESVDLRGTRCVLGGEHEVVLPLPGGHHALNAAAAWLVGMDFGLDAPFMIERLRSFAAAEGRSNVMECGGVTIVDDSYNANPASMMAAIDTLRTVDTAVLGGADDVVDSKGSASTVCGRRVLVMGDMLELGAQSGGFHERVLGSAVGGGIDLVVVVGDRFGAALELIDKTAHEPSVLACASAGDAGRALVPLLKEGDCVWIKGSRSVGLERVVEDIRKAGSHSERAASCLSGGS